MKFSQHYQQLITESILSDAGDKLKHLFAKVKHFVIEMFPDEKHLKETIVQYFESNDAEKCRKLAKEIETLAEDYDEVLKAYYLTAFEDVKRIKDAQFKHEEYTPWSVTNALYFIKEIVEELDELSGKKVHESLDTIVQLKKEIEELEELIKTLKD